MDPVTVVIPVNFTDAGKILGLFELRNVIEAVILCVPLTLLILTCLPLSLTVKLVITSILVVPAGGFSLIGVHDYSLISFLRIYLKWRKNKEKINKKSVNA